MLRLTSGFQVSASGTATFYFAGHGDLGASPHENIISTWGNDVVSVTDVVTTLNAHQNRPFRVAMTSCFSGGFSDIIFSEPLPDPPEGSFNVRVDRCGVFASTWDLEAGGCDPDPERGNHEGFGVHFVAALKNQSRDGATLELDLNADGSVSLLEAFTQARIAAATYDVYRQRLEEVRPGTVVQRLARSGLRYPVESESALDCPVQSALYRKRRRRRD